MGPYISTRCAVQLGACFLLGVLGYSLLGRHAGRGSARSALGFWTPAFIEQPATDLHAMTLSGTVFDAKDGYQKVEGRLTVGVVHWFTPYVEKEAALKFLGPPYENVYQANQAALLLEPTGHVTLVARVWLNKKRLWTGSKDRKLGNAVPPVRNNFNDNWLFHQRLDTALVPQTYSDFLGIPAPSQYKYMDGPSDPRLFLFRGQSYLLFSMDMALNDTMDINYPVLWDFQQKGPIWIEIEGGSPFWNGGGNSTYRKDRHWSPLVVEDELYFVHSLDPLRVLSCRLGEDVCKCSFVSIPGSSDLYNEGLTHLRGGTPFVLYRWPYYVSFAQSVMLEDPAIPEKVYTTHLVMLSADPIFRLVYVSQPLKASSSLFETAAKLQKMALNQDGFVLPVAVIKEDLDTLCLSLSVNDESSVLLRLTGLQPMLQEVMTLDEYRKPTAGPILNSVQQFVHSTVSQARKTKLIHREL